MRRLVSITVAAFLVVFALVLWAGTPGTFRGVVIHGPGMVPGWMFLKSANGQVRRVAISRAQVVYADGVPVSERQKTPELSIVTGADVRVTAEQDGRGEWRAIRVEILSLHGKLPIEPSERSENLIKV